MREEACIYEDEQYSVRDNGEVLRHLRDGKQKRKQDGQWTFGKPNDKTGYMEIGTARVHRIVATAFHGAAPTKGHVVDHIDTNKRNNRPENLRWVTRLENILLNPITAKRIAIVCGSVEAFLENPAKFRDKFQESNVKWMASVSSQEATLSLKRLLTWADSDKLPSGGSLDKWIFNRSVWQNHYDEIEQAEDPIINSKTPNAVQKKWKTPNEFPYCPQSISDKPIMNYATNLKVGNIFSRNQYSSSIVTELALSTDKTALVVMCQNSDNNAVKPWSLAKVTFENNLFIHTSLGSFFKKDGVEKYFTIAQGLEWTGGDTFDDLT